MTMPNFFVIGAAKAGTTSFYHYLQQHPDIFFSPIKEPKFFALEDKLPHYRGPGDQQQMTRGFVTDLEAYQALFGARRQERAVGEASTLYLYSRRTAACIHRYVPEAKLIAILRNPVDRAYSNFLQQVRDGYEPLTDFVEALRAEETRIRDKWMPFWHYRQRGFYYRQLRRYFDLFDRPQIKVYLYEDLKADPQRLGCDVFRFLEVDDTIVLDTAIKYNVSGWPKHQVLHKLLVRPNPVKTLVKGLTSARLRRLTKASLKRRNLERRPLPMETRRWLTKVYREDVLRLQDLIERDLSAWVECEDRPRASV